MHKHTEEDRSIDMHGHRLQRAVLAYLRPLFGPDELGPRLPATDGSVSAHAAAPP
jgi:hypothetical protein